MSDAKIRRLTLDFPHGADQKACDQIARDAQKLVGAGVSEGGFRMIYMPMTLEEEKRRGCEFAEDEMHYIYGHKRD
jgi:hypothetical protein